MGIGQFILVIQLLFGSIAFLKEFIGNLKLFGQVFCFLKIFDPFFLGTQVPDNDFSFLGVIPKVWSKGFFLFVGNFY
jgi:hypothetical protein